MKNVTVDKADLLKKMCANRDGHREQFLKALEGYRKAVVAELEKHLDMARTNGPIHLRVQLPAPQDHSADYDRVIGMLEMSTDQEIELTEGDFERYVRDEWEWSRFVESTSRRYS